MLLKVEQCLRAMNFLKGSNKAVYFKEEFYFPICFLEVHFSTVFLTHILFYVFLHALQVTRIPNFPYLSAMGLGGRKM